MGWSRVAIAGRNLLIAAPVALVAMSAQAADLSQFPSLMPGDPPVFRSEYASGWYLRGDVGYRWNSIGSAATFLNPQPTDNRIDNAAMFGTGLGYKYRWFRADITADYGLRASYDGNVGGVDHYRARVSGYNMMLNGYFDLGTWSGVTPYVGAGIGTNYMNGAQYQNIVSTAGTPKVDSRWSMSWAWIAGLSYKMSPHWLVDVSYRHVDLGWARAGSLHDHVTIKDITGDEVRVGLRYLID